MHIDLTSRAVNLPAGARERLSAKIAKALRQFAGRVTGVSVVLAEGHSHGHHGGSAKKCKVVVDTKDAGPVALEERDACLNRLFKRTAGELGRAVRRHLAACRPPRRAVTLTAA